MKRCSWCNLKNNKYINYHDNEWGVLNTNEHYLYKMFILETFQAGLSWECILNKGDAFTKSYDNFDINKVVSYDDKKINDLASNKDIIRNRLKIKASINNSIIYKNIVEQYGTFYNYLCTFTNGKIYYENNLVSSPLSDSLSNDLKKRGMKFVGSVTIYSYLQAIGIIYSHEKGCFLEKNN